MAGSAKLAKRAGERWHLFLATSSLAIAREPRPFLPLRPCDEARSSTYSVGSDPGASNYLGGLGRIRAHELRKLLRRTSHHVIA